MSALPQRLRIATRQSQLALWQTHFIQQELQRHYPTLTIERVLLSTRGDEVQDRSLAKVGGKGLFIKALEEALLAEQADIAVHSLKDVPALLDPRFTLAATPERANPLDALISPRYASLADLPHGARVGTSSPRRSAQLLAYRPDLNIQLLRGNVDTRLTKCLRGDYDAIILACAGLERLGLAHHIRQPLPVTLLLPAAGQGIMAVECLSHRQDLIKLLAPLNHPETFAIMTAERALVQALNGDCHSAIGAYARVDDGELQLTGNVTAANGIRRLQAQAQGSLKDPAAVGQQVAEQLLQQGARTILLNPLLQTLSAHKAQTLTDLYPPKPHAQPGPNTAAFFAKLPTNPPPLKEIAEFRDIIALWDQHSAHAYPDSIPRNAFEETAIAGIPVYRYRTPNAHPDTPTLLYLHGGGFCVEALNVHCSLAANIAARMPCHIVLPRYSLSPEIKLPTAINEVTAVLAALLSEPQRYGVTDKMQLVGYSSGGNLALNAALNLLQAPTTRPLVASIANLIVMSPWTDVSGHTSTTGPYLPQQNADLLLTPTVVQLLKKWCLPAGATGQEPYISPLYRPLSHFQGLPKTTIIVGELDRILTDSIALAQRLVHANVATQLVVLEGQSHDHSSNSKLREDTVFTPEIIAAVIANL